VENVQTASGSDLVRPEGLGVGEMATFRAWAQGLTARAAVERYLPAKLGNGRSARGVLGRIREQLVQLAEHQRQPDLAKVLRQPRPRGSIDVRRLLHAVEVLIELPIRQPGADDLVGDWLPGRYARALDSVGIKTLAELAVRVPRRRQWWKEIPHMGEAGGRVVAAFFSKHPELIVRVRALVQATTPGPVAPWERLVVPLDLDGSAGTLRAPTEGSSLAATNDYQAVTAWLDLHETGTTRRSYCKEVERLVLWCLVERGKAMSSLTTEDATAYRAFLRRPWPASRWIGKRRPRSSTDWRPFNGPLAARSVAYALSVVGALFRWLIQQRYLLANPWAGIRVKGAERGKGLDPARSLDDAEWRYVREIAEMLEWSYGWEKPAAQRMRFLLDFAYATGLRAGEFVEAKLRQIETDDHGDHWLHVVGKGGKRGRVALPPLARAALERYLVERGLPVTRERWSPGTSILGRLSGDGAAGVSASRLRAMIGRFFTLTADLIADRNPAFAEKLRQVSPHWMRHTHATHALNGGAELTTVRDNLRHASIATTSLYLHVDDVRRSQQLSKVFSART